MNTSRVALVLLVAGVLHAQENPWSSSFQLEAKGSYAQAAQSLSGLSEAEAKDEFSTLRIAWLYYLNHQYSDSVKLYKKALAHNPMSLDARLGISLPLMAQQKWSEATKSLQDVLVQSPWDFTAHLRLMEVEQAQAKWDTLSRHASDVSARFPSDTNALVYLARAETQLGHRDQSRVAYEKVLRRYPGHLEALKGTSTTQVAKNVPGKTDDEYQLIDPLAESKQ